MSYWLISVPSGGQLGDTKNVVGSLQGQVSHGGEVTVEAMKIPRLKVGTLDSLMTLSDDLDRVDRYVEGVVHRLEKEIRGIINAEANPDTESAKAREVRERTLREMKFVHVRKNGVDKKIAAEAYLKQFEWDTTRFPEITSLPEHVKEIQDMTQRNDEDLKVKQMDYNQIKSALATAARKKEGNLSSKSLVDVVKKHHVTTLGSERLETVFCAVPKAGVPDFLDNYAKWGKVPAAEHPNFFKKKFVEYDIESLSPEDPNYEAEKKSLMERQLSMQVNAVVPKSAGEDPIDEDTEYALFPVVIFKCARQSFEADCNSKSTSRVIVRDYTFKENQDSHDQAEATKLAADEGVARGHLKTWAETSFSECYKAWIHLKVIRVFVESVLRFGVKAATTDKIVAMLVKPGRHEDDVRKKLGALYNHLADTAMMTKADEASVFYPYVDIEVRYTGDPDV